MKSIIRSLVNRFVFVCGLITVVVVQNASALQISLMSDTNFWTDFGASQQSDHVSVNIANADGLTYSNLWVTIGSFTNASMQLGGGEPGQYPLGKLTNAQSGPAYFYVQANTTPPNNSSYNNRFTVSVYNGYPSNGVLLASSNFPMIVQGTIKASANKVNSVTFTPTNNPVVGGTVRISVFGDTGGVGSGNLMDFTAASFTNWNGGVFQLVASSIVVTNGSNPAFSQYMTNTLMATANSHFTGSGNLYEADYWFRVVGTTGTNSTPVSPVSYIQSGSNMKHTDLTAGVILPPVLPTTNLTTLNSFIGFTQLYTNQTVTFTLAVTNLSTAYSVTLDRFVDTLPAGFVYVANSSTFGGAPILDPTNSSQVLTWSQGGTYTVPAGSTSNLVFKAVIPGVTSPTYFTNFCVGYVENFLIGTNLTNPGAAKEVVRALIAPIAGNTTNVTALENQTLTVPAPGVLANTVEPNGFTPTIFSNSTPVNGSVTVSGNGSYAYTPASFFWGWDSFTFVITNSNFANSTGTNYVYINWVNQPPYFTEGANQTVNENTGSQTIANWANGINSGTNDPAQTLTFHISNNNNSLFSVQPSISSNGTLTYTLAPFAYGSATVSVYLTDNGGTANGGNDTSPTQTFTITVNWVNQPPYFTKGANQTVNENSGAQTVTTWATGISQGTNDPAQVLTFHVSSDNSGLFSAQPALSSNGTLTYTPALNAFGTANVSVYLTDDAGGISSTQTFVVTVNQVNQPPTLNVISNLTLVENWNSQTVNLSGITSGPTNESSQTLTVTAASSNPSLIPNPTVNYTSPGLTGSLTFIPATNSFGNATITVVVKDNGGTANGGIDSVTNTFNVSVLGLTNYWYGSSNLTVNISDATGVGGVSQTNYTGVLSVPATSTNPFTIKLASLNGSSPGAAANFNNASNYTWTIATTTRGVIGWTTNQVIVDTSAFTNDLAGGYFTVITNGSSVNLVYTGNLPPVAYPLVLGRAVGTSLKISIPLILTNYSSDPNGDARLFLGTGASTNGAYITTNSAYIWFAPVNNVSESFQYYVRDNRTYRPGDTMYVASNWITVVVTNAVGYAQSILGASGNGVTVRFAGVPGYAYDVQRATNVSGPWFAIATTNAPPNGVWIYNDSNPPQPSAYYRTAQH